MGRNRLSDYYTVSWGNCPNDWWTLREDPSTLVCPLTPFLCTPIFLQRLFFSRIYRRIRFSRSFVELADFRVDLSRIVVGRSPKIIIPPPLPPTALRCIKLPISPLYCSSCLDHFNIILPCWSYALALLKNDWLHLRFILTSFHHATESPWRMVPLPLQGYYSLVAAGTSIATITPSSLILIFILILRYDLESKRCFVSVPSFKHDSFY